MDGPGKEFGGGRAFRGTVPGLRGAGVIKEGE